MGWFGAVRVTQVHWKQRRLIKRARIFDFHGNYVSIMHRFSDIARYWSKVADHPKRVTPLEVTPLEFRQDLWRQKTEVNDLSYDVVCVILGLAVLVKHRLVTDRRTDGHTMTTSTALL